MAECRSGQSQRVEEPNGVDRFPRLSTAKLRPAASSRSSGPPSSLPAASSQQEVDWPTLFVAHFTSLCKWRALFVGVGLVRPTRTRPGCKI